MGTIGITDGGWLNSPLGTEAIAGALSNFNKVTASDLEQLKNATSFKIKLKKEFGKYKVGDILQVKSIRNTSQSEPPNFIVIEEKLGAQKYSSGGRGWLQNKWFENYDGQEPNVLLMVGQKSNMTLEDKFYEKLGIKKKSSGEGWGFKSRPVGRTLVAIALIAGYFAYKKFKK